MYHLVAAHTTLPRSSDVRSGSLIVFNELSLFSFRAFSTFSSTITGEMPVYLQKAAASRHQPLRLASSKESMGGADGPCPVGDTGISLFPFHPLQDTRSNKAERLLPLEMTSIQSKFITSTMEELKERVSKRQKIDAANRLVLKRRSGQSHLEDSEVTTARNRLDIVEELDAHPQIIQVVASPGGLITHWTERFANITKPSASLQKVPLTIFELVDSKSLSSLYSMVALSLHNIGVAEVEHFVPGENQTGASSEAELDQNGVELSSSSHLSITLPCKAFRRSSVKFNITIVFMDDEYSRERCFLGLLTPQDTPNGWDDTSLSSNESNPSDMISSNPDEGARDSSTVPRLPCGKVLRVDDNVLCQMLLGTSTTT
jgi:hypothetical protein